MKALILIFASLMLAAGAHGDFSCPDGTNMACLDAADTVCPATAKCVDKAAVCLDASGCDSARGYICGSEYDAVWSDHQKIVSQYNELLSENVSLREDRLEKRNCVINAQSLKEAISCVRQD